MQKQTKATDIPKSVKEAVWERDGHRCIICGSSQAMPNAHYISRAHGGLGIEENIVTLCIECHNRYDNSALRSIYKPIISDYLKKKYENWNEKNLFYKKFQ